MQLRFRHGPFISGQSTLLSPREGYDQVSDVYDDWHWSSFWSRAESPLVCAWLQGMRPTALMDVGSGTGRYVVPATSAGHRVLSLDLSRAMLAVQCRKYPDLMKNVRLVQAQLPDLPIADGAMGAALCTRVLSHVRDIRAAAIEIARVLGSQAECYISDIHPEHPYRCTAVLLGDRRLRIETFKHSIASIREAFNSARFDVIESSELGLADLPSLPSRDQFSKLFANPARKIFYILRIRKLSRQR